MQRRKRPKPRQLPGYRLLRVAAGLLLIGAIATAGVFAGRYLQHRSYAWQLQQGRALVAAADTAGRRREALDDWWQRVAPRLAGRERGLVEHVMSTGQITDYRARLMLTRATGADYGDRTADWRNDLIEGFLLD